MSKLGVGHLTLSDYVNRIEELEAQLRQKDIQIEMHSDLSEHRQQKLAAVKALPDKWREDEAECRSVGCSPWMDANYYAKELEAAIAGGEEPCKHIWRNVTGKEWMKCIECGEVRD